ncbi:hypothetical protein [Chryseobacterium sp. KCF3-3]|uniref:hypothetical protein n=1 Tax=Chryseobacterium sp. KCF3-3 TaxID=3231511 RepID=UPI0038B33FC5
MENDNTKITLHIEFEENPIEPLNNYNEFEDFERLERLILYKVRKAIEEKRLIITFMNIPNESKADLTAILKEL